MPTPQQLTEQLARAYALTELLPLRHSNVQEVLAEVTSSLSDEQLDLEVREEAFWTAGERLDGGPEVTDFAQGLARCGVESLQLGPGLEKRALGALLDTVRIASISGHLTNLKELVAYHGGALQVAFGAPAEAPSALGRSAGAIFAGALSSTEAGGLVEEPPVESGPLPVEEAEESGGEDEGPHAGAVWDPPGSDGDGDVALVAEAPDDDSAPSPRPPEGDPVTAEDNPPPEGDPSPQPAPDPGLMKPAEFRKGVELFMGGEPAQRRGWADPLKAQAARVDVDSDPETALDILLILIGTQEPEEPVAEVARKLGSPAVARELTDRLGQAEDEEQRGALLQLAATLGRVVAAAFAEELATSEDRAARRALVHALTFLGAAAIGPVTNLIRRPEWYVVRNALTVLPHVGDADALDKLEPCLSHGDARVRREAVLAVAKLDHADGGRLVIGLLGDPDPDVRASAIMVAGVLNIIEAAPEIRRRLPAEENEVVVIEALRTLGSLDDGEAVAVVRERAVPSFFSRPSKAVRIAAYRALSRIGTPEAVEVLEMASDDRDPEVRGVVQQALESLG